MTAWVRKGWRKVGVGGKDETGAARRPKPKLISRMQADAKNL